MNTSPVDPRSAASSVPEETAADTSLSSHPDPALSAESVLEAAEAPEETSTAVQNSVLPRDAEDAQHALAEVQLLLERHAFAQETARHYAETRRRRSPTTRRMPRPTTGLMPMAKRLMRRPPRQGTNPVPIPGRPSRRRGKSTLPGILQTRGGTRIPGSGMPTINRSAITSIRGSTAPWRPSAWGRPRGY